MINMSQHPLLMQAYELSVNVDRLTAHVDQTDLITALGEWRAKLQAHLEKHGLLMPSGSASRNPDALRALEAARDALYNGFEPDNQSRAYKEVCAAIGRLAASETSTSDEWRPMVSAPLDGTDVAMLIRHHDYWTALKLEGKKHAEEKYQGVVLGKWIDHNGGGWTWHGGAGSPVGWRPKGPLNPQAAWPFPKERT